MARGAASCRRAASSSSLRKALRTTRSTTISRPLVCGLDRATSSCGPGRRTPRPVRRSPSTFTPHRWMPRVLQHDGRPREQLLERFRIERLCRSVDESEHAIGKRHLRVPVDSAPLGSLAVVPVAGRATLDDRSARLVFTPQEATVALAGYARLVRRMYIHDIRYIIYAVGHCSRGRGNEDEDGEPRADQLESGAARKNCRGPRPRDTAQSNGGPTEHGSPAPEVAPRMGQHSVYP